MNLIFFYFSLNIFSYFFLSFLFYITESILDNFFVYIHFFTLLGSIWLNKFPHMRQLSCLFNYSSMIDVGNIWQLLLRNIIILCVLFCLFLGQRLMENLPELDTFPTKAHGLLSNCEEKWPTESTTRCCSILQTLLLDEKKIKH